MTTGRINQVASPYKLNKRWVFFFNQIICMRRTKKKTHLKITLQASLLVTWLRAFGMRFELTRFQKIELDVSNKVQSTLVSHWREGEKVLLTPYSSSLLESFPSCWNNRAKQLNSEFTPDMDWDPLGVEV